jgi:chemotaxis response regulator CheB
MRLPQVVVYETDGWLASQVADLSKEHSWLVRESRQADACLRFLVESRPSVLLLKLEHKLVDELSLLSNITEKAPDCPVIVFSFVKLDSAQQRSNLAGLAYDLGARYVMFPPLARNVIEDVVVGLMEATIQRCQTPTGAGGHA